MNETRLTTDRSITTDTHISIVPVRGWAALELKEVWKYRGLLYFLPRDDIKVR